MGVSGSAPAHKPSRDFLAASERLARVVNVARLRIERPCQHSRRQKSQPSHHVCTYTQSARAGVKGQILRRAKVESQCYATSSGSDRGRVHTACLPACLRCAALCRLVLCVSPCTLPCRHWLRFPRSFAGATMRRHAMLTFSCLTWPLYVPECICIVTQLIPVTGTEMYLSCFP